MDSSQRNLNGHVTCTRVISVQELCNTVSKSPSLLSDRGAYNGSPKEEEGKSFIQQRIERLYGPAALGMAFQARRALLERCKEKEREETESLEVNDSPLGLPSVFRHLRPEFRHQLPVKTKGSFTFRTSIEKTERNVMDREDITNGHRVRHIPIEIEMDKEETKPNAINKTSPEKTWKTLSHDLNAVNNKSLSVSDKPQINRFIVPDTQVVDLSKNTDTLEAETEKKSPGIQTTIKDGNYFLNVVALEISKLEPRIAQIDHDLKDNEDKMPEEVKGKLLAASGKAKLLISQKIEQFRGLCLKNISKISTEEFPTTNEDLAGFWDMVNIQVEHVKDILQEVERIRSNGWMEVSDPTESQCLKKPNRKVKCATASATPAQKKGAGSEEAKRKAQERRKQMREALIAKRKQTSKLKSDKDSEEIEIFVSTK